MIPTPTYFFHRSNTKSYHPTTTVRKYEPLQSPSFHLVASTRQIRSTCFTPESRNRKIDWLQEISNDSNSHWHLCNQLQPYPSQPHFSRKIHLLIKTVFIGPSHMESPTGLSQAPLKHYFPTFHCGTSSFCCLPIFSSLESVSDNNHKFAIRDHVRVPMFWLCDVCG